MYMYIYIYIVYVYIYCMCSCVCARIQSHTHEFMSVNFLKYFPVNIIKSFTLTTDHRQIWLCQLPGSSPYLLVSVTIALRLCLAFYLYVSQIILSQVIFPKYFVLLFIHNIVSFLSYILPHTSEQKEIYTCLFLLYLHVISFASIIILDFKVYYEDIVVKQFDSGINIFNIFLYQMPGFTQERERGMGKQSIE